MNIKVLQLTLILLPFSVLSYSQKLPIEYSSESARSASSGDYNKAIRILDTAIINHPQYALFYIDRGRYKSKIKLHKEAIADYSEAIKIDSNISLAYYYRSETKTFLNDLYGALSDLDIYISRVEKAGISIDLERAFFNRGLLKIRLNKIESGCLDLSKAGELGYSNAYNYIKKYCQ